MSRKQLPVLIGAVLFSGAVLLGGQRAEAVSDTGLGRGLGHEVSYCVLEQGRDGPWMSSMVRLFSCEAEWDAAMSDLASRALLVMAPVSAPRDVDWSRQAVILVTMGELSGGDYSVQVRDIIRSGPECVVDLECSGSSLRGWGRSVCRPYQVVVIEKHGVKEARGRFRWTGEGIASARAAVQGWGLTGDADAGSVRRLSWGALKAGGY